MNSIRKSLLCALAAAASAIFSINNAVADAYPDRPVKVVVAYQAGQGTDVATRYLAEKLSAAMGKPFIVENRPGAYGNIGTVVAAKSKPDGYTLVMGTAGTHAMNPNMMDNPGFDAAKDFEPIALTCMIPMAISVNPSLNVNSLPELVALAKSQPDKIDVALPSITSRLVLEMLKQRDVPLFGVLYKGTGTAVPDVVSGRVPVWIDTVAATRSQAGKVRPIAVTSSKETEILPGVKSVSQQGLPDFEVTAWNVLMAPHGTPPEIIERLRAEMQKILALPETAAHLRQLGFEPAAPMAQRDIAPWIAAERSKFGTVIKRAHISLD